MRANKGLYTAIGAALGLCVLILDAKNALVGAMDGIELCISTVIPSLFPFFVISGLLTSSLTGRSMKLLRPLGRLLGIPCGCESLLMIGLLGGYPVGAQSISQAHQSGQLKKKDARRMLGFCSNAGPAFLFGMCGSIFSSALIPWVLWGVLIFSSVVVGCILPGKSSASFTPASKYITISEAMASSVRTMGQVCGWVVLFRVVITFFQRWFFWMLPQPLQVALKGFLELSNGCIALYKIPSEGLRFILCGSFLAFGGVCVGMQTVSVTQKIGTGMYFPGKILQLLLSSLFCALLQPLLFSQEQRCNIAPGAILISIFCIVLFVFYTQKQENKCSNLEAVHV